MATRPVPGEVALWLAIPGFLPPSIYHIYFYPPYYIYNLMYVFIYYVYTTWRFTTRRYPVLLDYHREISDEMPKSQPPQNVRSKTEKPNTNTAQTHHISRPPSIFYLLSFRLFYRLSTPLHLVDLLDSSLSLIPVLRQQPWYFFTD